MTLYDRFLDSFIIRIKYYLLFLVMLFAPFIQASGVDLKIGLNATRFYDSNSTLLPGFQIGISFNHHLTDHAIFENEIYYVFQGSVLNNRAIFDSYTYSSPAYIGDVKFYTDKIEFSWSLKFLIPSIDKKIFLLCGPSFSWWSIYESVKILNVRSLATDWQEYGCERVVVSKYDTDFLLKHPYKIGYHFGIGCNFNGFSIEFKYSFCFQNFDHLKKIGILKNKINDICFIISF